MAENNYVDTDITIGNANDTTADNSNVKQTVNKEYGLMVSQNVFAVRAPSEDVVIRYATNGATSADLFNALNAPAEKVSDHLDETFDIVSIVISEANISKDYNEKDNPDAEKELRPVVHFYTSDGTHLTSVSNGIVRSTKNLLNTGFVPMVDAPVSVVFKERKTKKGNMIYFEMR